MTILNRIKSNDDSYRTYSPSAPGLLEHLGSGSYVSWPLKLVMRFLNQSQVLMQKAQSKVISEPLLKRGSFQVQEAPLSPAATGIPEGN